jgi:hypothetical protein
MDWTRLQGAAIRFFWATLFPLLGWFVVGDNLESIGVPAELSPFIGAAVGGVLYGLKRYKWPNTTW